MTGPTYVLTTPHVLTPSQRADLRRAWAASHAGTSGAHRVVVLEGGLRLEAAWTPACPYCGRVRSRPPLPATCPGCGAPTA